jgi:DNA-binding protein H-NS
MESAQTPNIDSLTFSQLAELNIKTQDRMESLREDKLAELLKKVTQMIENEGFKLEDVVGVRKSKKTGNKAKDAKYRHPADKTKTWAGKGRIPKWLKELENSGKNREEYLIPTKDNT